MFETDCCPGCGAQGTLTFRSQPRYGGGGRFPQRAQVVCRGRGCSWRGATLDVRNANVEVDVTRKAGVPLIESLAKMPTVERPGRRAGSTADQGERGA